MCRSATVNPMTVPIAEQQSVVASPRRPRFRLIVILVFGVLVVPFVVSAVFNSYGPLTEESAIRMAFATVVGQVLAVLSGFAVIGLAVKRRYDIPKIVLLAVVAVVITVNAFAVAGSAGDLLLSRLDLIAETNLLNQ